MSASAPPTAAAQPVGRVARALRIAFLGPPAWLDSCTPPAVSSADTAQRLPIVEGSDVDRTLHDVERLAPRIVVVFEPTCLPAEALRQLPGTTLGILVGDDPAGAAAAAAVGGALDRVVSFRPSLTGTPVGAGQVWRAIPAPVSDALFGDVRPLHGRPRAMSIGRSTVHREYMLMPTKHDHDLLQIIHGISGEPLAELLSTYDVGIYVPPKRGGGFGAQVGIHLAAGQLLLAERLHPTHGLERGLDYLPFDTREELAWTLHRLARFPEMHQRLRVRGRMKAEAYRASRLFARVGHDLLADVAAFGCDRTHS